MNKVKKENKELNAVEWIRGIRDKNYNKYKGKSDKEYIELINNKAKKLYSKKKISRKVI